jgi:hypothetical protein
MSPYEAVNSPALLKTVEEARTYKDHYALIKHFENLAEEMRARANEQRKLLDHYQEKAIYTDGWRRISNRIPGR